MTRCITLILSLLLPLAACSSCGGSEGAEPADGNVPAALLGIESAAEDVYDKALSGDLAAVAADAATLDGDWQAFRPQAQAAGATDAVLGATDQAVAGLTAAAAGSDGLAMARAANAVSAAMPDLFSLFQPAVPPALLTLDCLGRELALDGKETDFTAAAGHLASLSAAWEGARAQVLAAGGATQASQYDASLSALDADASASDAGKLVSDANAGLDLVDEMEKLFQK